MVTASLYVNSSQVTTEWTACSEQEVCNLWTQPLLVIIKYKYPTVTHIKVSNIYFAGEERVDFFLALCRQTSRQVIKVVSLFNDRRPVEVVR